MKKEKPPQQMDIICKGTHSEKEKDNCVIIQFIGKNFKPFHKEGIQMPNRYKKRHLHH